MMTATSSAEREEREPRPPIDYKDIKTLKRFISEDGKILPRRRSGLSALQQREMTSAVKRARHLALLPYTNRE
jgi:small subunit ribosomal protein S18